MEGGLRRSMAWLHTWAGVTIGALLFAIFWMGTLAVFDAEIDRWMIPETRLPAAAGPPSPDALWRAVPAPAGAGFWSVQLPTERNPTARVTYRAPLEGAVVSFVDPTDGAVLPPPRSLGGTGFIYPFHVHLHFRAFEIGYWVVGFAGMAMLALIASGVIIHRKIFADFFSFRLGRNRRRSILDLHNVCGVLALPFHVMITLSGLVIFLSIYYPAVRMVAYAGDDRAYYSEAFGTNSFARPRANQPAPMASLDAIAAQARTLWDGDAIGLITVFHPGDAGAYVQVGRSIEFMLPYNRDRLYFDGTDGRLLSRYEAVPASRVQRFIAGLHFIQFRHWTLRFLYFFLGLTGCVLIATGFLFWLASRRRLHAGDKATGLRLVEGLTVGSVTGLVIATCGFFVANRVLDHWRDASSAAAVEVWTFCLIWASCFAHAWIRPLRAWAEQCWAVSLCAALAVALNWLTTGDHLLRSLGSRHLWPVAGMDLALLACAVIAAAAARRVTRPAGATP